MKKNPSNFGMGFILASIFLFIAVVITIVAPSMSVMLNSFAGGDPFCCSSLSQFKKT